MGAFQIEKWYFDAHDEEGNAFIGYAATLTWKSLKLFYNGYTFSLAHSTKIVNSNSFSSRNFPEIVNDSIRWNHKDVSAEWIRTNDPVQEVLLDDRTGIIDWQVVFPSAKAKLGFRKSNIHPYVGYVEKIKLTIPPWNIPIKELYWGRFLAPANTIIWIRWKGPIPKNIIYHNGTRHAEATISTESVDFGEYSLLLTSKRTLRKGTILSTVFKRFPAIVALFPKKIFALSENKWLSDAVLTKRGGVVCEGKAIHEHVIW